MGKKKEKDWRLLERLAYEYVHNIYKDAFIIKEEVTVSSHDSGFDGIWLLTPENEQLLKKILMEAKFRTTQTSLPLNDCAKAIIIAFNLSAQKLYLVTNIGFAPQAKEHVKLFKNRSNMAIICVSGAELKAFIQDNKEYLTRKCKLPLAFLDEIINSSNALPEDFFESYEINSPTPKYLLDDSRKIILSDIITAFSFYNAIYLVAGSEGIGKSVIGKKIKEQLLEKSFDVCNIDLSLCTSSRVLYLKVLEAIWGVELTSILEDQNLNLYIDQLIAVSGASITDPISNAIKHILATNYFEYEYHKDIYLSLLLKYIDYILREKHKMLRLTVFFENLNLTSEEVLDFLLQLVKCLKNNNVRVLLEVRTPFLLKDHINLERSEFYFERFKQSSDGYFLVDALDHTIATELIHQELEINSQISSKLADVLDNNPLEIQSALELLRDGSMLSADELNKMTDEQLEMYWNSMGISANSVVMSLTYKLRLTPLYASIFDLTVLLNGEISYFIIEKIWHEDPSTIITKMINSTIFKEEGDRLICKHQRFLAAMKKTSQPMGQFKMAEALLPIIRNDNVSNMRAPFIELDLLYILSRDECIPQQTSMVISLLMDNQQYKDALQTANRYIRNIKEKAFYDNMRMHSNLQIVLQALMCIRELHYDNDITYEHIYEMAHTYILLKNPDLESNREWYEYCLLIWHKEFIMGNFIEAYHLSKPLYDELERIGRLFNDEDDYPGQVYNAYGLSTKMISGGHAAEQIFIEGNDKYPDSHYIKAALLSQIGNRLLKTEPLLAADSYKELLSTVQGKTYPYQEILHTRIDVAMSYFLAGKYDVAKVHASQGSTVSASIGIFAQEGRAKNILGCCQVAEKEYESSIKSFSESISLLSTSNAQIYLWRAQLNLASVLLLQKNENETAFELISRVLTILTTFFKAKINEDKLSVPGQSLLLILMYLYENGEQERVKKILKEFRSELMEDFSQLSTEKNWKKTFHNKVTCCGDIVMITG